LPQSTKWWRCGFATTFLTRCSTPRFSVVMLPEIAILEERAVKYGSST